MIGTGSILIIVISSSEKLEDYPEWLDKQAEIARLSSNSEHIIAESAGHFIQYDEPQLVSDKILELLYSLED